MNNSNKNTVWITGMGAVTPIGLNLEDMWQALLAGADGICQLDRFDTGGIACTRAGLIRNFPEPELRAAGSRAEAYAYAAAAQALQSARLEHGAAATLVAASNFGALDVAEATLANAVLDPRRRSLAQGSVTENLLHRLQLRGVPITLSLSCASGAAALAYAATRIAAGELERAVVVGFDAISQCAWSGLCALRTMTRDVIRPFDQNRAGTIFAEGAGAMVLETALAARRRGVEPLATLRGWATGNNGFHMTAPAPHGAGSAHVMRQALQCAALTAADIDHFNAHGTGTKPNDVTEFEALEAVLGTKARTLPVTANKSILGHMLGAAGAVEAVIAALTLRHQTIPPTTHFVTPDTECPVNLITQPQSTAVTTVLANAAGFGGCNAALVLQR